MAANQQLATAVYALGGQLTLSGWELPQNAYSFEEDTEDKQAASGIFKANITYSRRQTLSVTIEALTASAAASVNAAYITGGQVASGVFTLADGSTATAWKIRSATRTTTRGPIQVELDLIQLGDMITTS
jgi:hypothetical protein